MTGVAHIFDRALVQRHRDRAAAAFVPHHSALVDEIAGQLLERLADVKRRFMSVLDLGSRHGALAQSLVKEGALVIATDLSEKMLRLSCAENNKCVSNGGLSFPPACGGDRGGAGEITPDVKQPLPNPPRERGGDGNALHLVMADEELAPFAPQSFDLIVSNLNLHWVNDLPGTLAQIKQALKPDGLFLATLFGGQSLHELRACLLEAELTIAGGAHPRLSPSIDLQTASALLQRAGFHLPVTDQETVTLAYPDMFALLRDLRGMGETNAQAQRSRLPLSRDVFRLADRLYRERFALKDGRIPATFEVIFMHGWREALV